MDEFDKKIKHIKISRSPELFLEDIFSNCEMYLVDYEEFYVKNNEIICSRINFNSHFYYNADKIYITLRNKYHLKYLDIVNLIKIKAEQCLKVRYVDIQDLGGMFDWTDRIMSESIENFIPALKIK